jgi:hypothetical protein
MKQIKGARQQTRQSKMACPMPVALMRRRNKTRRRKAIWTHFEKLENFRKAFPTTERIQ